MAPVWQDAATRDVETVRATIDAGVDVDSRDRYGQTFAQALVDAFRALPPRCWKR